MPPVRWLGLGPADDPRTGTEYTRAGERLHGRVRNRVLLDEEHGRAEMSSGGRGDEGVREVPTVGEQRPCEATEDLKIKPHIGIPTGPMTLFIHL